MSFTSEQLALFKLDWLKDPETALARGRERGISDPHFVEMSSWCAELHAQLAELAGELQIPLLLMGGNAAALRLEAANQRGSRDNDYLTTASEAEIRELMDALVQRFAPHFEESLFRYRELHGGADAEPLPLVAFAVDVPAQLDTNAQEGRLSIKLEFHIEDDPELFPEGESVSGQFFALRQDFRAILPRLPHQVGLKLMTLVAPPVGIDAKREDAIPRQLYDIDALLPQRLGEWAQAEDGDQRFGQLINGFQASQVARATRRPLAQWRGRARRLQFAARCLAMGADGFARWQRALEIERRMEEPAGRKLRAYRTALSAVVGVPARQLGQFPRVVLWEHVAAAKDVDAALDALDDAL